MTWVKLDDGFTRHPRMVAAGLHGRALFVAGLCYCGTHLTDGFIPKAAVAMLVAEAGCNKTAAGKLVEVGSWIDHGDRFEVHDFLVYNPSRAKVVAEREANAERQRKARESRSQSRRDKARTNGVSVGTPTRPEGSGVGAGFIGGEAATTALAASGSAVEIEEEPLDMADSARMAAQIRADLKAKSA